MDNFQRERLPVRAIPIRLDHVAKNPLRFPVSLTANLPLLVTEFVDRYERTLFRTLVNGGVLVKRSVLDSPRLNARHLPLCPTPQRCTDLPSDDIDCVAHVLDHDTSFYNCACFVLRVRAKPGLIAGELYITAAPKALGMVAMQFQGFGRRVKTANSSALLGSTATTDQHRSLNAEEEAKAKEIGEGILHIVQGAMEEAAMPLLEASARERLRPGRPTCANTPAAAAAPSTSPVTSPVQQSPLPSAAPAAAAPPAPQRPIKRRSEEN